MRLTVVCLLLSVVCLMQPGCEKRTTTSAPDPFKTREYDYVLAVVLDMSASFSEEMQENDARAYNFFMRLTEKYFRQRIGFEDRILLTQLSAGKRTLLWEGPPGALKRQFPDSQAFADFLLANSNPRGSHVYAAMTDTLNYIVDQPGITENTDVLTVVLSDLLDNDANAEQAKRQLQDSLRRYGQRNGHIGLYWVDQEAKSEWTQILTDAGFTPHVWIDIVDDPDLPDFEY